MAKDPKEIGKEETGTAASSQYKEPICYPKPKGTEPQPVCFYCGFNRFYSVHGKTFCERCRQMLSNCCGD